jgi:hypothetical protein
MAIRDADYPPVELLIVTGLDEKARVYVDQHAKRSAGDMLKIILNKQITNRMAAVLTFHQLLKEEKDGFYKNARRVHLDELVDDMTSHAEYLTELVNASGTKARAGVMCALFHYGLKFDPDRALQLAEQIRLGEGLRRDDPAYRLREYITSNKSAGLRASLEDYKMAVTACLADALGEPLKVFRPSNSWTELPRKLKRYAVKNNATADEVKSARAAA